MKLPISKKLTTGCGLTLAILAVNIGLPSQNALRLTEANNSVAHTLEVLRQLEIVLVNLNNAEMGQRGYLLIGEPSYLEPYQSAIETIPALTFSIAAVIGVTLIFLVYFRLNRDLAERKRAEALLPAASEGLFRSVTQSARDAIIAADDAGNIILWNPAAQTMFGYTEDEVMGQPLTLLMPEQYRDRHRAGLARYMSTGLKKVIGKTVELQGLRKNGDEFPLELSLSVCQTDKEAFFSGIIRDITKRKQTEALHDSEKRFRGLIENSSDAIALFSAEGTILYGSPATSRILGYPLEEFMGRNAFELIHPDDHEFVLSRLTEVMQEPGARINVHAHVLHNDGSWRFLEGVFTNLLAEPAVGAIVNNYRDITGRKQMEQALQKAHDELEARVEQRTADLTRANEQLATLYQMGQFITAPLQVDVVLDLVVRSTAQLLKTDSSVILLLDEARESLTVKGAYGISEQAVKETCDRVGESIAGRVVQTGQPIIANDLPNDPRFYNPAAVNEGLLACASVPLVVGEKIIGTLDVHSKVNRHAFTEAHLYPLKMLAGQAAIAIENARLYEEVQRGRNELEERVQQRTAELVAANEQLQQEIAERKRAEAGLRQAAAELARSNDELQQFAYVASHDLQEPLRMVASYTQLLARRYKGKLDADADDFINYAVDGANRMRGLINDLLTYSRLGTRGKTLEPLEAEAAFGQAMANLQAAVAESSAIVTYEALPTVLADDTQLVQLFQNLIGNALKFRTAQPPQIHVSAARQDQAWVFSVQDNGIGIEPQYAGRIFVIFQRLHSQAAYPGSGIGLAICKRVVERHNGCIWFESQPGQGTIFYFTLPVYGEKNDL